MFQFQKYNDLQPQKQGPLDPLDYDTSRNQLLEDFICIFFQNNESKKASYIAVIILFTIQMIVFIGLTSLIIITKKKKLNFSMLPIPNK